MLDRAETVEYKMWINLCPKRSKFGLEGVLFGRSLLLADGFDFANVLVKVKEGRPVKIEPNKHYKS
jgi:hypothetical protein